MKCAIIGGGASGLVCAVEAVNTAKKLKRNISVTVFEKNDRVGKKILATGNGRCNMTNLDCRKDFYFGSPDFAEFALKKFSPENNIEFFKSLGLFTRIDSEGRVYPLSNQASSVLDALRFACERNGVNFQCGEAVTEIQKKSNGYIINGKEKFDKIVFACGGKAAVKDFNGYDLAESLSLSCTKTAPSLVRLTTPSKITKQLKGIRAAVELTLIIDSNKVAYERGELLFGDFSLSGIAAMQLSAFVSRHFLKSKTKPLVYVDFVPDFEYSDLVKSIESVCKNCAKSPCENLLSGFMPKKIGTIILKEAEISTDIPMGKLTAQNIKRLALLCKKYVFEIDGTKGFSDAQVTSGGIITKQFNKETLESKKHKGLFCCGEMLDVDGLCGGYNLQWAWSSGRLCGKSLAVGD